jgi:hypothetical protein
MPVDNTNCHMTADSPAAVIGNSKPLLWFFAPYAIAHGSTSKASNS